MGTDMRVHGDGHEGGMRTDMRGHGDGHEGAWGGHEGAVVIAV